MFAVIGAHDCAKTHADTCPRFNVHIARGRVGSIVGNFIEMRDKTALRKFRAKKKLDHLLEAALPGVYLPLYTMVTFTRIPYAEAARRARRQDRIVYTSLNAIGLILIITLSFLLFRFIAR